MSTAAKAIRAVLLNKDISELLSEDREIFGPYSDVYDFIGDYYSKHNSVPTENLLSEKFDPDILEGAENVDGATRHYMNELRDEYLRSQIEDMLMAVSKNIHKRPPSEIIEKVSAKVADMTKHVTRAEDISIMDVDKALADFKEDRDNEQQGTGGIKTGIPAWDEFCPTGMLPGMNIVLFGYSGRGKSWIADYLAVNAFGQRKKVLFLSLEMSAKQQRQRIWSIMSDGRFPMYDLQRGLIADDEVRLFVENAQSGGGDIIVTAIDGVSSVTPNIIKAKIEKHKPDLVIVDYLQLMRDNGNTKDMTPRMLNLSGEIKRMAVSEHVPVVTISAVTDDEGKKRNSPPTIAQVAWSRAIEYDADLAVAVHKYDGTNIMEIACRKNRNGDLFNMQYEVDLSHGKFEPVEESDDEEN